MLAFFKKFQLTGKRQIYRVLVSHTIRGIALSCVSVYVPIYFFTRGHSLTEVVGYYALLHFSGLLIALTVIPRLIERFGLIRVFKLNYPFEIAYFALLFLLPYFPIPIYAIAFVGGMATFFYWVPLNILLIKNADFDKMGTDLANFFALPKFFSIVGPLVGAALVYFVGFWPTFLIAMFGLILSYLPLVGISVSEIMVAFNFRQAWQKIKARKLLFFLEGFDNIIEESEWFWGIYIFLIVGSLMVPGIIGSLGTIGAVLFTLLIGKRANRSDRKIVLWSATGLMLISAARIFVESQIAAYAVSVVASFAVTAFLISYFSVIYRAVKGEGEEEFIILREIPTVLGRMIVFGGILLTASHPGHYFLLPLFATLVLVILFLTKMRTANSVTV
jgi:MFS family permease